MRRSQTDAEVEQYVDVAERLRPYLDASTDDESQRARGGAPDDEFLDALMQRAVNLLAVMPVGQRRETVEDVLAPNDLAQGRRAVDALIEAAYVAEDQTGHLHLLR